MPIMTSQGVAPLRVALELRSLALAADERRKALGSCTRHDTRGAAQLDFRLGSCCCSSVLCLCFATWKDSSDFV